MKPDKNHNMKPYTGFVKISFFGRENFHVETIVLYRSGRPKNKYVTLVNKHKPFRLLFMTYEVLIPESIEVFRKEYDPRVHSLPSGSIDWWPYSIDFCNETKTGQIV